MTLCNVLLTLYSGGCLEIAKGLLAEDWHANAPVPNMVSVVLHGRGPHGDSPTKAQDKHLKLPPTYD